MTERTRERLLKKWPNTSFEDFYEITSFLHEFEKAGGVIPKNLNRRNHQKTPGLLVNERLEKLFLNAQAWKGIRDRKTLHKKLERFLNFKRPTEPQSI